MRRRTSSTAVATILALCQGCGSCDGDAAPAPADRQGAGSALGPGAQRFLKTTATENKGLTLDGATAESLQRDR